MFDWGFTRSDVTYDVVSVWNGTFFRLEDHLDRFDASVRGLRMKLPVDRAELREILMQCVPLTGLREAYVAMVCTRGVPDHLRYLVRLAELGLIDRERRMVERRIRKAKFPAVKSLDSFDFKAIPSLNKMLVLELARCEYIERRENVIALGNGGTGKTHVALGVGLAACHKGLSVGFTTAAALVHELMEARDEKRLLRLQKQLAKIAF